MRKQFLTAALLSASFAAYAEFAVIANPSVGDVANDKDIKKLFMGKKSELAGATVVPTDQKEGSLARKAFYEKVVGQTEEEVKAYRIEMVFTGKSVPPKEFANDAAVKAFVSTTPGGVGYVDASVVDGSVKVLFKY